MANKTLFKSLIGRFVPAADAVNEAGGLAYALSPRRPCAVCRDRLPERDVLCVGR